MSSFSYPNWAVSNSPNPQEPGPEVPEGRNWTRESSMDPGEDGHFFRAISCAHRGKYNRALSSSFLRQISALGEVEWLRSGM